ncbi:MAG: CHASE2 domain-containing protein [Magnetococcales bacterium]|nr:CHASE2 domain-containing protein [Magnetococcales bacterium]
MYTYFKRVDVLIILALFLGAGLAEFGERFSLLEDQTLSFRHILRLRYGPEAQTRFSDNITLVKTDETFFDAYGGYPMKRADIGKLVQNLHQLGAKAIVVDFLMDLPSAYGEDEALARRLKSVPNVVVASRAVFEGGQFARMGYPVGPVRDAARSGYANLRSQSGLVTNVSRLRIHSDITVARDGWPLAVAGLSQALGVPPSLRGGHLRFGQQLTMPLDRFHDLHLPFPALPDGIEYLHQMVGVGALDFLEMQALDEEDRRELRQWVKDKIVVIGDTSEISKDWFNTPVGRVFGPEIIAISIDAMQKKAPLQPAETWLEWLLAGVLLLGLMVTAKVNRPVMRNALSLSLLLLYLTVTTLAFVQLGVIFSLSYWALAFVLGLIGVNLRYYALERRQKGQVQQEMAKLVQVGISLSSQSHFLSLLEQTLKDAQSIAGAEGSSLYLVRDERFLEFAVVRNSVLDIAYLSPKNPLERSDDESAEKSPFPPLALMDEAGLPARDRIALRAYWDRQSIHVPDVYALEGAEPENIRRFDRQNNYRTHAIFAVPMRTVSGEVIGVFQLINPVHPESGKPIPFTPQIQTVVEAFASQAAVALDNKMLADAQKQLLDSFIQVIAGAIDAKSPYTGGHCQRVPELAKMLAKAARDASGAPFDDYQPDENDLYELNIAAWMHDCGKVTTPEYVVDKATKLETIYNRLHEVRMRFEVLWRDAEIAYWQALIAGGDKEALAQAKEQEQAQLRDDFAFIAECNEGGEFMADARIARLQQIAGRSWMRYFDDRIGLSQDERDRKDRTPAADTLPVQELLLSDRQEHIIPRLKKAPGEGENPHGFTMKIPDHQFNQGELYNLSVKRGTLTEEERFKINEHAVQTLHMLHQLPFPKHLRNVPDMAGNHHETLVGTGYPRGLDKAQLTLPSRIMALADIFEALTASDRPYKTPKSISQAIRIMGFMKKDSHIDPDLFDLFLTSGVYQAYADIYLRPEQIDEVDVAGLTGQAG